ncbi:hypothetical protein BsWGS_05598 [Bradybaena similaris]
MDRLFTLITFGVLIQLGDGVSPLVLPCADPTFRCGRPNQNQFGSRVVGGQEAQLGAWPWMVALVELGYVACGGAIINPRLILTAAHCFYGNSNDPSRWQAIAGKHYLLRLEPQQKSVKIEKIILHGDYNNITLDNDIALLVLAELLIFSTYIQPICIPDTMQGLPAGYSCLLAGWGKTEGTGDSSVLNQVMLPIISDDSCSSPDWYWTHFIPQQSFCAGYEAGGRDACQGDSGGPLICKRNDTWFIQGISSWGSGCAEYKWPGIYTNISMHINWIRNTLTADIACQDVIGTLSQWGGRRRTDGCSPPWLSRKGPSS